jgi:hypothetical protein
VIKLKVFWLKKYPEEIEKMLYRSFAESKNISTVDIKDNLLFKYLTLTNPIDSRCIYTLHELNIKLKETNIFKLLSSDDLDTSPASKQIDSLQIVQDLSIRPDIARLELTTVKNSENLFKNNYAILLPGGSLIIEAEKNLSEVALCINWSVEEF